MRNYCPNFPKERHNSAQHSCSPESDMIYHLVCYYLIFIYWIIGSKAKNTIDNTERACFQIIYQVQFILCIDCFPTWLCQIKRSYMLSKIRITQQYETQSISSPYTRHCICILKNVDFLRRSIHRWLTVASLGSV